MSKTVWLSELAKKAGPIEQAVVEVNDLLPEMVEGRVLQLDGDSAAYKCSGTDETPLTTCKTRFKNFIKDKMAQAGAPYCNVCMTGGNHSKGGRYEIAKTKPYQEQRTGTIRPVNLAHLREWILSEYCNGHTLATQDAIERHCHTKKDPIAVWDTDEEADDTMTQHHWKKMRSGAKGMHNMSVITSEDKDLFMNTGWFLDWNTGELTFTEGYGETYVAETPGGTKKLGGKGRSCFFHQLLMGDTADTILGLPYFAPLISAQEFPDGPQKEQARRLKEKTMPSGKKCTSKQLDAAQSKLTELVARGRTTSCGPVSVVKYLSDCTTEKEAFLKCLNAYVAYYGKDEQVGDEVWQPIEFLLESARLLWMRRTVGEDVTTYIKEIMK